MHLVCPAVFAAMASVTEASELPSTLPTNELKRYLKAAGVASGALKQADSVQALIQLAARKRVSLVPLKRQGTSVQVREAASRETSAMGDDERLQYEQAFDAAMANAVVAARTHAYSPSLGVLYQGGGGQGTPREEDVQR